MNKQGMCWCMHDKLIVEWCYDFDGREEFIKGYKPANEVETRLKEMKMVKGKLPKEVITATEAANKAHDAYRETQDACNKGTWRVGDALLGACDEMWAVYLGAQNACNKVLKTHKAEIEKLHTEECPDSCWNGERLVFPE